MKRRGAVLLLAVAAAVGLSTASAGAEGSRGWHARVLVVDKDSHHHKSCYGKHRRTFRTIQSAVDAADPGDTIKVCPGTYKEVVTVTEPDLTIKGANAGQDATRHGRGRESIIAGVAGRMVPGLVQLRADDITWDGFTILGAPGAQNNPPGMYTSPAHSGYLIRDTIFQDNGNGIHLGTSGTHPTLICRNRFVANNEFEGPTGAYGIYSNEGARQVLITTNRFERHNGAAIFLADQGTEPRQRDVLIEHNKSVDDMSFATIFNSTRVRVTSNWIRARVDDPPFTDEPASAIFIGARNNDIVVQKNKIKSASGNGIDISTTGQPGTDPAPPHERGRAQEQGRACPVRHPLRPRDQRRHRHRQHRPRQRGRLQGRVDRAQEHLDRQRRRHRRAPRPLHRPHPRRRARPRRQGPRQEEVQEAQEAPQEDQEAEEAPPGPVRLHAPLALLT